MARNKTFKEEIAGTDVLVAAEADGEARYMVRMAIPGQLSQEVRIGYLTGSGRKWVAEFFGTRPAVTANSAREACLLLAKAAVALLVVNSFKAG